MNELVVPERVSDHAEEVTLRRAWPLPERDGRVALRFEGTDDSGRIRAGEVVFGRRGGVHSTFLAPHGVDPRLPGLTITGGRIIGHRLGRRAVTAGQHRYAKVVRPSAQADTLRRNILGGKIARLAGLAAPVATAGVAGAMYLSVLPGRSLHDARLTDVQWATAWSRWAQHWPRFTTTTPPHLAPHRPEREAAVLLDWVTGAVDRGVLTDGAPVLAAATRVVEGLTSSTPTLRTAHRDLHDKQLLFDPETARLGLIDLDTLVVAEPALDLGNLAAHLAWRVAQRQLPHQRAQLALDAIWSVSEVLGVDRRRLELAVQAAALRLGAVNAYRPGHQPLARRWAGHWASGTPAIGVDAAGWELIWEDMA